MSQPHPSLFFLGCAVWAYKDWVGDFYPAGSRSTDFLKLYSQRLTTVEGNTTFYAIPSLEMVNRWVEQTPSEFQFCLKLPRDITHRGQLQSAISDALSFWERMSPLGSRLGPIFAQLPPRYAPTELEDLTAFLEAWPHQQTPLALEVRHPDWFIDPYSNTLTTLLKDLGVGQVLLDSRPVYSQDLDPQLGSTRRKPNLPVQFTTTTSFSLVRFISHPQLDVNIPFLQEWVTQIKQWLTEGIRVYFFVHCPQEQRSPTHARQFQTMLEQSGVDVPPLPWNQLDDSPIQLSLW
ncbi:MAG: DUF72 domain-containing protein [Cyanobacteriota bacterium]|nr:DUF72 domain-containing protein [Cyanobacteriota bacterium]